MALLIAPHRHAAVVLATCPSCGHGDLRRRGWVDRLLASSGHPHQCAYAVGDEISPLRNEMCGCADPIHARGVDG